MSTYKSSVQMNAAPSAVYSFLADMNNHGRLMPENVINWSSTMDVASFEIQNITKLSLKVVERVPDTLIKIIPAEKAPFEMELTWNIKPGSQGVDVTFTINAELSMMMKMLAGGQLQKLTENETQRLAEIFS